MVIEGPYMAVFVGPHFRQFPVRILIETLGWWTAVTVRDAVQDDELQSWDREEDRRDAERLHTLPRHAASVMGPGGGSSQRGTSPHLASPC